MTDLEGKAEHKVFSRLIDFLNRGNQRINWDKYCWRDEMTYDGAEVAGHLDNEFGSTHYFSSLDLGEINLNFDTDWGSIPSPRFSLRFTEWVHLGLDPKPRDIVLFYNNPYYEEKTEENIPIYQARYDILFVLPFAEARTAMKDFIERGTELAEYFTGIQNESKEQFLRLIERFRLHQDNERVVRVG